jgi:EF-P beta-lysylation protein EpmB
MHQPDQLMRKDLSNDPGNAGPIGRSGQILAGTANFVPTGLDANYRVDSDRTDCDWQTAMKRAVRSTAQLRQAVDLPDDGDTGGDTQGGINFPTFVPWEYIARIRHGDPDDPLLRQVLPVADEQLQVSGFTADPVGDIDSLAAGGLLHKYDGRALVITTGVCGVHCRYCFRREFPYSESGSRREDWQPALEYIQKHSTIDEVILSGGDPLTLVDQKLDELIGRIEQIRHVRRLRIHSRMPIVIPQRVTPELVTRLSRSRLASWLVVHANHPNELDQSVLDSLAKLIDVGIPVLNQAVLLRGVNDDANTLIRLCRTLVNHRVQPYYLHQLDRVMGAAHFEVAVEEGNRIMAQLRDALPGYAVPSYVTEQSGNASKTPIDERIRSVHPD